MIQCFKMAWQESGGGGDSDSGRDPASSEPLTSPDPPDEGQDGGQNEDQPLINNPVPISASGTPFATPKSQPRSFLHYPATPTISSKNVRSISKLDSESVPIMVNLDPTERISLNKVVKCYGQSSIIPRRGATVTAKLTMSTPRTVNVPTGSGTRQLPEVNQSSQIQDDTSSIQVAITESSPNKPSSNQLNGLASIKMLCGPHPKKVTIIVTIILSIWASFILGINIQKKVMTMEDRLASMTQKMLDLQMKYLDLQEESNDEINKLHHRINELSTHKNHKERIDRPVRPNEKPFVLHKRNGMKTPSTTTTTTSTTKDICKTKTGKVCILPFKYKNSNHDGCIQRFQDFEPWCAISVDENGSYSMTSGSWENCDPSCPLSSHNSDVDTWF